MLQHFIYIYSFKYQYIYIIYIYTYYVFISVIHFSAIPSYPQVLTLVFSMDCSRAWQPPIEKPVKNGGLDGWFRFEFPDFILGVMA